MSGSDGERGANQDDLDRSSEPEGPDPVTGGATRLTTLVSAQEALLRDVGYDVRSLEAADDEYRWQHKELAVLLRAESLPCYCPWNSVHGFPGWATKQGDVETALARLLTDDIKRLTGLGPAQPKWTLVPHPRWVRDFVDTLSPNKQQVLDAMLRDELAVRGLEMLQGTDKLNPCGCDGGGTVLEYRIQRKTKNTEYKLRVFVDTRPGNVFVLLHGFDKSADDNPTRQNAAIQEACRRQRE